MPLLATVDRPPCAASPPVLQDEAREPRIQARLEHLFRHSLQAGRVNPLLHIVLRLRLKEGA